MINENSLSLPASLTAYSDSSYRPWDKYSAWNVKCKLFKFWKLINYQYWIILKNQTDYVEA